MSSRSLAIAGIGIHPFGRNEGRSGLQMAVTAARAALADAGITWPDIQFAVGGSDSAGRPDTMVSRLGLTGLPFTNVINGCATGGAALLTARSAIASGDAGIGLVVGFDKLRQMLADLYVRSEVQRRYAETMTQRAAAGAPGEEGSVLKLMWSANLMRISAVMTELLGPRLAADTGEPGTFAWSEHLLGAPGYRIAGGTEEIQRNIIAERMLGLPREPRPPAGAP